MSLTLDQPVSVTVLTSAVPPSVPSFGSALFLGRNTVLPLESRVLVAFQPSDVTGAGFTTTQEEYLACSMYFSQSPRPTGPFKIGRQFLAAQSGKILSGGVSQVLSDYTPTTNGGFDITIDGVLRQVTAINLSGAASMAAIAALIQTRVQVVLASTTCTFTNGKFVITSPTTGATSLVGYAAAPTGGGAPTDISALLKLTTVTGARAVNGIAIETLTNALDATRLTDAGFYGASLPEVASTQDWKDLMAHAQANKYKAWVTTHDVTTYDPNVATDLASYAKTNTYDHTFVIYSSSAYAAISAMAREQVVDITQPSSFNTLAYKQLPGISADNLTSTQVTALQGKNCNYYTSRGAPGGSTINVLEQGKMGSGQFSDEVFGLDAFAATYQNAIFVAMAVTPTKIPQTDKGGAYLLDAGRVACEQFVRNGFFAPGTWASAAILSAIPGQNIVNTGDYLKAGYIQYIAPVSTQSVSDRAARKTPPITVVAKGAGAFHSAAVTFVFDR